MVARHEVGHAVVGTAVANLLPRQPRAEVNSQKLYFFFLFFCAAHSFLFLDLNSKIASWVDFLDKVFFFPFSIFLVSQLVELEGARIALLSQFSYSQSHLLSL